MLIIEGSGEGRVNGVRVLNHCVFCLTKLSKLVTGREIEAPEPGTARKYIRKTTTLNLVEWREFPTADLNRVWREVVQRSNGAPLAFPKTPPICQSCGTMLRKIYEALRDLDVFVNTFRTEMKCCGKDGSKAEEKFFTFVQQLKEAQVEDGSRRATLNFLEKLGHGGLKEEEYLHYFPKQSQRGTKIFSPQQAIQAKITPVEKNTLEEDIGVKLITVPRVEFGNDSCVEIKEEIPIPAKPPSISNEDPLSDYPDQPINRKGLRKTMICDLCKAAVAKKAVGYHVRSHVGDYALSCPNPECRFVCAGFPWFKKHFHNYKSCAPFLPGSLTSCSVCDSQFTSRSNLYTHMRTTHECGPKRFPCPVSGCLSKFANRQSVQLHISYAHVIKHGTARLLAPASFQKCPECEKKIHEDRIRAHLETFHKIPPVNQVPCKYCFYVFSNHSQLLDHLPVHTSNGTPVACHKCPLEQTFLRASRLREHYFKEHLIGTSLICEHCSQQFFTIQSLTSHVTLTHSENPVRKTSQVEGIKCEDCKDGPLYTKDKLLTHRITQHGAEPLNCQFCEEIFTYTEALRRHENKHKGLVRTRLKYTCDIPGCGKDFESPSNLNRHKLGEEHLGKTNAFLCPQCGKGYNTEHSLKHHLKLVHVAERKLICEDCEESFKTSEVLKKHKRIHTGERPFECPFCKQRFRTKEVLKVHVDSHKRKGADFKPNGPMAKIRKRVNPK